MGCGPHPQDATHHLSGGEHDPHRQSVELEPRMEWSSRGVRVGYPWFIWMCGVSKIHLLCCLRVVRAERMGWF